MSNVSEGKKKPETKLIEPRDSSWEEKKCTADKEAEVLGKQIEDIKSWTNMIDSMDDEQLKEYLKSRPDELKTVKIPKSTSRPRLNQRAEMPKCSTSNGIMASVWKFHKEEEEDDH